MAKTRVAKGGVAKAGVAKIGVGVAKAGRPAILEHAVKPTPETSIVRAWNDDQSDIQPRSRVRIGKG